MATKLYTDGRGWTYKVRPGLGHDCWKGFYAKPGKGYHACRQLKWHDNAADAEADLKAYAAAKGWDSITEEENI